MRMGLCGATWNRCLESSPNESMCCCSFWEKAFKPLTSVSSPAQMDPPLWDKLKLGQHSACIHMQSTLSPLFASAFVVGILTLSVSIGYSWPLTLHLQLLRLLWSPTSVAARAWPPADLSRDSGCWSGRPSALVSILQYTVLHKQWESDRSLKRVNCRVSVALIFPDSVKKIWGAFLQHFWNITKVLTWLLG